MILLNTTYGDIKIELFFDKAPVTCANFVHYVNEKFYDNTLFHRVIDGFMIQGGGFDTSFVQKTTHEPIINEANNGLSNIKGTIAMARTSDPHSASAQFFINVADNIFLDYQAPTAQSYGYCVFGKIIEGMDVIEKIQHTATGRRNGHNDVPLEDICLNKAAVIESDVNSTTPVV